MKKTILFVEDDLPTIDVYGTALKKADFRVETIVLGGEAIERVREIKEGEGKKPDLVLLDLILPDMNGIEVLKEIRKHKETKDLSVFILTNYTDKELEKMGYELKSERCLLKTDYPPNRLIETIKERLGK